MFDTIKDMYTLLFEFLAKIIEFFGYRFDKEEGKIEPIEDAE